ncbi:hypothetical protein [Williamsia muralis]|uniref:Uncharacterized protein n=1 Tax=Williamsia marianensis TaxID=85044 RepID=A0ABU4EZW5_WILMA|nr:hypothetical protein [Williamsia muralis]MDV7136786.1 hypothetical protein [Williamsia muralis]
MTEHPIPRQQHDDKAAAVIPLHRKNELIASLAQGGPLSQRALYTFRHQSGHWPNGRRTIATGTWDRSLRTHTEQSLADLARTWPPHSPIALVVENVITPAERTCHSDNTIGIDIASTNCLVLPLPPTTSAELIANTLWESDNNPLNAFIFDLRCPLSHTAGPTSFGALRAVVCASNHGQHLLLWLPDNTDV